MKNMSKTCSTNYETQVRTCTLRVAQQSRVLTMFNAFQDDGRRLRRPAVLPVAAATADIPDSAPCCPRPTLLNPPPWVLGHGATKARPQGSTTVITAAMKVKLQVHLLPLRGFAQLARRLSLSADLGGEAAKQQLLLLRPLMSGRVIA